MWTKEKRREYDRQYREANKDTLNEYQTVRRRENPERTMLDKARGRAREYNRDFNLELSDIKIPPTCPVLGIPLIQGEGKVHANSPVLDRIDNAKGYVKGNVAVISQRANQIKTDLSLSQLEALVKYMTPKSDSRGQKPINNDPSYWMED